MKRALLITGSVVLAFAAVIVWILIFSGLGVLLEKGWDGGDITMFVIVFPIAVALSVGAILLMLAGVRYKQSSAAAPHWPAPQQPPPGLPTQWPPPPPGRPDPPGQGGPLLP